MALVYVSRKVRSGYFYFMVKRCIDYAFKSYVLREHSDLLQKAKKSTLVDYAINELNENGIILPILRHNKGDLMNVNELYDYCNENGLLKEFRECFKINTASYKRTKRLKERIESMLLNGACLFLTLTFNDDTLNNTTLKERRVAVSRYLKSFNCPYVANIDYGAKNHREHYHAIINIDKVNYALWNKYGAINGEKIRNKDIKSDKTKLAKYICKLTNHAIKETTQRSSLIYSR